MRDRIGALGVALGVGLVACGGENPRTKVFSIVSPPPLINGQASALRVPSKCPVYAPGGGDVDTPEDPFPREFTIVCGIDGEGGAYGVVTGDAPTARLAVLPGSREIGVYIGFAADRPPQLDKITSTGATPTVEGWAAPVRVDDGHTCCAELEPNASRPVTIVALGPEGMLLSLGIFDASPTQAVMGLDTSAIYPRTYGPGSGYVERFYVAGVP